MSTFQYSHYFESNLALVDDIVDNLDDTQKMRRLMTEFKMDKNRMLVILLTRLLRRLLMRVEQSIDQRRGVYAQALHQFCLIAQEFCIEPVIKGYKIANSGKAQRTHTDLVKSCISTPVLEFVHCMLKLL